MSGMWSAVIAGVEWRRGAQSSQGLKQLVRVSSSAGSPYKVEFSRGRSGTSRRCCCPTSYHHAMGDASCTVMEM